MKYGIRVVDLKKETDNEESIQVDLDVPLGDVPYYVALDEEPEGVTIQFAYPGKDREPETVILGAVKIKYGKTSGRLYEISGQNADQIATASRSLMNWVPMLAGRFSRNVELGRDLVIKSLHRDEDFDNVSTA